MKGEILHDTLVRDYRYDTPAGLPPGLMTKLLPWSDTAYRLRLLQVIFNGAGIGKSGHWSSDAWYTLSRNIMIAVEKTGAKVHIEQCQHLAAETSPVVIVANHMSLIETLLIPSIVLSFHEMNYVVKQALCDTPVFRHIMDGIGVIPVGRAEPREDLKKVLTRGTEILHSGKHMAIFPQSTRTPEFSRQSFGSLGVKLAKKAGVKVLPMAIKCDFQGLGRVYRDFGPVYRDRELRFCAGPAVEVTGNGREAHEYTLDFITSHLTEWGVPVVE
jgi:1-acyl-sn-glycerol-3-phosphate acyltransferase